MSARVYTTTAYDRASRMKAKIDALDAAKKIQVADALRELQKRQVDEICVILESSGISESKTVITNIDDINNLFKNLGLSSGGRKSRRRKPRKTMKSRRRRY